MEGNSIPKKQKLKHKCLIELWSQNEKKDSGYPTVLTMIFQDANRMMLLNML